MKYIVFSDDENLHNKQIYLDNIKVDNAELLSIELYNKMTQLVATENELLAKERIADSIITQIKDVAKVFSNSTTNHVKVESDFDSLIIPTTGATVSLIFFEPTRGSLKTLSESQWSLPMTARGSISLFVMPKQTDFINNLLAVMLDNHIAVVNATNVYLKDHQLVTTSQNTMNIGMICFKDSKGNIRIRGPHNFPKSPPYQFDLSIMKGD